jgi:hypothetical protein
MIHMQKGFDCSATLDKDTVAAFIKAKEKRKFAIRYLNTNWKGMFKPEAHIISDGGLMIGSAYERNGDRAGLIQKNGAPDGADAFKNAIAVGQPKNSAIYLATDYDAKPADMNNIEAYLRAADKEMPGYGIGVYGSYYVIEEMFKRGVCKHYWQTVAWSDKKISQHANIFQKAINIQENGITIDDNESYGNEGFWSYKVVPVLPILVKQADADLITAGLGSLWELGVTILGGKAVTRDELHRLADVVRAAIGKTTVSISKLDQIVINAGLSALWGLGVTNLKGKAINNATIHRLANVVRAAAGVPVQP